MSSRVALCARSIALSAALASATTFVSAPSNADTKVAVVDTQRAIMETEDGLRAQATLKKLFDSRQREIDVAQQKLAKDRDAIEKQRNLLSQAALKKLVEQYQSTAVKLQASFVQYNRELQAKEGELTRPIYQRVMEIIARIARADGYDLVVDRRSAPYARGDLDLTDRIVTDYNKGGAPAAPAAKPAPAKPGKAAPSGAAPAPAAPAPTAPAPAAPAPAAPAPKKAP